MAEKDGEAAEAASDIQAKLEKAQRNEAIARAAEAEANRRTTTSAAEAARFREQAQTAQTAALTSTVAGLEQERDRLKAEYSQALADGEFDKVADLQFKMGEVATKLTNATIQKAQIDGQAKTTKEGAPLKDAPFDKEAFLSARSPASAAWLRQHEAYFTDEAYRARVAGAHSLAVGNNLKVDSPEYFEFIEKHSGDKQDDDATTTAAKTAKGNVRVAAPPSRDGATGMKVRPGEKYISPEMRRYAEEVCQVKPEEYYDQYVDLVKEGKIEDRFNVFGR